MVQERESSTSARASFLAVTSTDPTSFVAALLLCCTVAIVGAIFIHSQVTGIQPKESWTEVSVGVALIVTVFLGVISYRVRWFNRVLRDGTWQSARLVRFLAVGIWVIVQLEYQPSGVRTERRIWLANSKRSRRLGRLAKVTVAMDAATPERFVVIDLFV
jgi:hypothetical protein